MQIRKIKKEDIEEIIKIGTSVEEFNISDAGRFWTIEQLNRWIESDSGVCLLAEEDGKIIGFNLCSMHIPTGKAYWENLWVNKDFRGKGIAEALVKEMEAELKRLSVVYISCFSKVDDVQRKFFEKTGFKIQSSGCWVDKKIS